MIHRLSTASAERGSAPAPDHGGFDAFYRRHAQPLRQALCLALGDVDLGTEATDEAMARACARWDEVATYANPPGWAYRVATGPAAASVAADGATCGRCPTARSRSCRTTTT
jgi:DNA-directed RNA polymerase specialized sigma24 family protein